MTPYTGTSSASISRPSRSLSPTLKPRARKKGKACPENTHHARQRRVWHASRDARACPDVCCVYYGLEEEGGGNVDQKPKAVLPAVEKEQANIRPVSTMTHKPQEEAAAEVMSSMSLQEVDQNVRSSQGKDQDPSASLHHHRRRCRSIRSPRAPPRSAHSKAHSISAAQVDQSTNAPHRACPRRRYPHWWDQDT